MPIIKVLDKWHNFFINFYWLNKAVNLCDNLLKTYFQFFEEIEMGDVFYELINTHTHTKWSVLSHLPSQPTGIVRSFLPVVVI